MSSKGEKIVLSKGDIVDEGLLTDLLARIKTEFNRRAQSSSGESLKTYITNNLSSFSPNDDKGDKVAASDGNAILKAIAVLSVVNKASASTQLSKGDLISRTAINNAYSTITNMESYKVRASDDNAGCKGACQGLCLTTCYGNCTSGCSGGCKGCTTTCNKGCASSCGGSCSGNCSKTCGQSCGNNCSTGCRDSCKDTCVGGSKGNSCQGSSYCQGACYSTCSGVCQKSCSAGCKTSCASVCYNACSSNCGSTCTGNCETYCNKSCSTTCGSGCKDSCTGVAGFSV